MDQLRIKALIDLMASSDLVELDFSEHNCTLKLYRDREAVATDAGPARPHPPLMPPTGGAAPPAVADAPGPAGPPAWIMEVRAPFYGVLHLTPAPDQPPFVRPGDSILEGQTLGLLEAMKMFHPVTADCAGTLQSILVAPGQEVDAEQPLFHII